MAPVKNDIVLAGVGGQGILTIAAIVGQAAMDCGLNVKQSEVHGMAQRGGAVVAHLRLSDGTIFADLIPTGGADVILAIEPMEALRQLNLLKADGMLLANADPVVNIGNYPDMNAVLERIRRHPRNVVVEAGRLAGEAGSNRAMNMVMLGALSPFLAIPEAGLQDTIRAAFRSKGEKVVDINLRAFASGREASAGAA
jgi:indolepyruvate ferredoxin oxidoreductase beta subunit